MSKIRVLLVDDSPTMLKLLSKIIESDPGLEVAGVASDGREAVRKAEMLRPELIMMDLDMPIMDGVEATRHIMCDNPTPILIVTGSHDRGPTSSAYKAIGAGAVEVVQKPENALDLESSKILVKTIKSLSKVKVIRRTFKARPVDSASGDDSAVKALTKNMQKTKDLVAIVASTGGPPALREVLSHFPEDFPAPIVIVQHTLEGFLVDLVEWLNGTLSLKVVIAEENQRAVPGFVYFAPDQRHLAIDRSGFLHLRDTPPEGSHRPAGNVLLRSVALAYGSRAVGVVLTGMGEDGALGLLELRKSGGFTISQDEATSAVYGMPQAAARMDACDVVLPLWEIGPHVIEALSYPVKD